MCAVLSCDLSCEFILPSAHMEPWHRLSSRLLPCYYQHIFNCLALEYNCLCDDSMLVYFYMQP